MKSWPKVKLGHVIICSNLVLSNLIWPQNTIFVLTYIYLYLAVFRHNYPYLSIFALNCPDFTICAIFTLYMYSSIETAPLCNILEQSDHYSCRYCISKTLGIQKCCHECSLGVNLVIDTFFVSDTSHLYKIWKQSDHYLSRYCILKIWGIQSVIWLRTQLF